MRTSWTIIRNSNDATPRRMSAFRAFGVFVLAVLTAPIFGPHFAFADYTAFQNVFPSSVIGGFTSGSYQTSGLVAGADFVISVNASTTVVGLNSIAFLACRNASVTGNIDLELFTYSTATAPIASSTLALSAFPSVACNPGSTTYATATAFTLNHSVAFTDTPIFIVLHNRGTGNVQFSFTDGPFHGVSDFTVYSSSISQNFYSAFGYQGAIGMSGQSVGDKPLYTIPNPYNASSTGVTCSTFDFGCYISTSFAYLFSPTSDVTAQFASLTLASSTPFNYLYQMNGYLTTLRNGTGSTSSVTFIIPIMGHDVTVFDAANMSAHVSPAMMTLFGTIRVISGYFLWFWVIFAVWSEVMGILRPQAKGNEVTQAK